MKSTAQILSKKDACGLLELIDSSLRCASLEEFRGLVLRFKQFIPFDMATCLVSKKGKLGEIESMDIVNVNYPSEWIELYVANDYKQIDPIIKEHFKNFRLQYWSDTYKKYPPPKQFLSYAHDFGLNQGYTHGVKSLSGDKGSLFSIAGKSIEHNERAASILSLAVPHLHQAFCRALHYDRSSKRPALSRREKEVLAWLKQGKTTWEISIILHLSERTVHFHTQNLMRKLNASSRAHAVALALEEDILYLD